MKRSILALLLLTGLAVTFGVAQSNNNRIVTVVAPYPSGTGLWDGGPEDSVAAGTGTNTGWVNIAGARQIEILVRDSSTALTAYVDSAGAFFYQLSNDKSNYISVNPLSFTVVDVDSFHFAYQGKYQGLNWSGAQSGVQFAGYLMGYIVPDNVEDFLTYVPYQWLRLSFTPISRPRNITATGNAAMVGVRLLVRIYYNVEDPYISPAED